MLDILNDRLFLFVLLPLFIGIILSFIFYFPKENLEYKKIVNFDKAFFAKIFLSLLTSSIVFLFFMFKIINFENNIVLLFFIFNGIFAVSLTFWDTKGSYFLKIKKCMRPTIYYFFGIILLFFCLKLFPTLEQYIYNLTELDPEEEFATIFKVIGEFIFNKTTILLIIIGILFNIKNIFYPLIYNFFVLIKKSIDIANKE